MGLFLIICVAAVILLLHSQGSVCMEIIGGNEAVPHSRPYMAFIKTDRKICGGTLIKADWVVTAAHCVATNNSVIILGAHSWKKKEKEQQTFKPKRIISHPCFDGILKINDIMLLQLDRAARFSDSVSVLSLPQTNEDMKAGSICSTAGWGVTLPKGKVASDVLRETNLTIVDRNTCNKIYRKISCDKITTNMLCAGPMKNRRDDTCQGDSGGPLVCKGKLRGIVSFGYGCGNPKVPGVYTGLTAQYLKWIRETTGGA